MTALLLEIGSAPSTTAGIATAAATIITAVSGLIIAFSYLIPTLKKATKKIDHVTEQTDAMADQVRVVHTIVNQQRTDSQRYNIALTELLRKHGIEIPIDQSLPVAGQPDAQPGQPH